MGLADVPHRRPRSGRGRAHGRRRPGHSRGGDPPAAARGALTPPALLASLANLDGAGRRFGEVEALSPTTFEVPAGALVAVAGRSGSGKSTLLGLLAGLFPPTTGRVRLAGTDIARLGDAARARFRRRTVALAPQTPTLHPRLTACRNVLLAGGRRAEAAALLERLGLGAAVDRRAAALSGGEASRVALARAVIAGAPLLLVDEPTGELDPETAAAVLDLVDAHRRTAGRAVVVSTHDPALLARADRVFDLGRRA